MRINHNIAALNTYYQLTMNTQQVNSSLQKLSSGYRINSAADDAAGLAISEKMRGQISGLGQAASNAQDGNSMLQTAEGALSETTSILQRMRELAVQSSNDTNTDQDRQNIQDEVNQLISEIDNISSTTQFNTKNLLDGSLGAKTSVTANINVNDTVRNTSGAIVTAATVALKDLEDANGNNLGITSVDSITVNYIKDGTTYTVAVTISTATTLADLEMTAAATYSVSGTADGLQIKATSSGYVGAVNGITITVKDSTGAVMTDATNTLSDFTETTAAKDKQAGGELTFQIGANTGQSLSISIDNMNSEALGVHGLDMTSQIAATTSIKVIDNAIQKVSAQRASLGAVENRMTDTIANLNTANENLTSAESNIRDVDMAKEMMTYTKESILTQASQSMLAQANQLPQGVLQLLR